MRERAYKVITYQLRSYDVVGDDDYGYNVNNTFSCGEVKIRAKKKTYNDGTPHRFIDYHPTQRQFALATGYKGCTWHGDGTIVYADLTKNGMPVCELVPVEEEN